MKYFPYGMQSDMLQNPSDPEAAFRRKSGKEHRGYVANLEESVGNNGSVVTEYQYEQNIHSDSLFIREHLERMDVQEDGRYKGESGISTWLCAIAKNLWRDYLRRQKHHVPLEEADQVSVESAESQALCSWDNVQILSLIHSLEDPMREVMYLRLVGNLTFGQIGEIMGRSENWARVPITAGKRESLRRQEKYELQDTRSIWRNAAPAGKCMSG